MKTNKCTMILSSLCILMLSLAGTGCSGIFGDDETLSEKEVISSGPWTVSYDSQSATTETVPTSKTVASPATTTGTLPTEPAKTGYLFDGWWTEINGGGTEFTATTAVTGNIRVYAKWNGNYKVTFDSNGGAGSMSSFTADTNGLVTLADNTFTKNGFVFDGWSTTADGFCAYQNKSSYRMGAGDAKLFARWCPGSTFTPSQYSISGGVVTITGCDSTATTVVIPSSIDGYPVAIIADKTFYNCTKITSVTIPSSVTSIGKSAFEGCSGLTSVSIPNSVISVGNRTFYDCLKLTSVTIPNSWTSLGEIFSSTGLISMTIPETVKSIGDYALFHCISLTSVTIPYSVESIGDSAFSRCFALTTVIINATTPPTLGIEAFLSLPSGFKIMVPAASVDVYKTAANWSSFASNIKAQ